MGLWKKILIHELCPENVKEYKQFLRMMRPICFNELPHLVKCFFLRHNLLTYVEKKTPPSEKTL